MRISFLFVSCLIWCIAAESNATVLEEGSGEMNLEEGSGELNLEPFCPDGWKYFGATGACYFVGSLQRTNGQAQRWCKISGGVLASVHSQAENDFVTNLISKEAWIGVYRQDEDENIFKNIDETPFDYQNWAEYEPNNKSGDEKCVEMHQNTTGGFSGKWNDLSCDVSLEQCVCKKPAIRQSLGSATAEPIESTAKPIVSQTTSQTPSQKYASRIMLNLAKFATTLPCYIGWKYFRPTGSCYYVGKSLGTNADAQRWCNRGGRLASIHSQAENDFIAKLMESRRSWIGVYRNGTDINDFANYDETPLDFQNWSPGEPNNLVENCVEMHYNSGGDWDGKWNDAPCDMKLFQFVCKRPADDQ